MFKRKLTFATLFMFLFSSTIMPFNLKANAFNNVSTAETAEKRIARVIQTAQQSAEYDSNGRVIKITIAFSDNENITVSLKYDEQNRIRYILQEDGSEIGIEYNKSGEWNDIQFPDGAKFSLVRDNKGSVVGFKRNKTSKQSFTKIVNRASISSIHTRTSFSLFDDCEAATNRATDAVIAAGLICLGGPGITCTAAIAYAAALTYLAYKACGGGEEILN